LDAEIEAFVAKLLSKPELAIHMTKTQLRGYARINTLGEASETDGDIFQRAMRTEEATQKFQMPKSKDS